MATVEKRRSSRKSGHRKHNDGGYSDTETDREVSSLTDRAFRSLCIGDEAVYNDSDLSVSPCIQRDTERQELKRTAHQSFSLRVQQYGQDWMYRGTYGAAIHKDQQWGVYGERGAQESSQEEQPPRELSLFSNGTTEVSAQQRRSNSRVSSLVKAFNSEGQGDEAVYNDETSWDKSALMSIEKELSEFSSYPQNTSAGYFPSTGIFSPNTNYYSSQMAAISQMNSASSFMRSSHSMSTELNSNFFIHSEFSPFKVWRDRNRFPFQGGQVSGFMPRSEFQKWYETPMYKELSLQPQQHPSMFPQGYHRNTFAPAISMNSQRSTSASTMMHRASAVEKRCESELAGQYRKRAQSTGANRLPPQRPSTASPSSEMSRRVRDTISSVKSLQQKIKTMSEQNIETHSQHGFCNNANDSMVPNIISSNPYAAQYQMHKSPAYPPPEPQQLLQQHSVSPQPVEHAPVRAESRGATPDVKMSSYKSRAANLLYNLKDNRKRVKATYSPTAFKGQDTQENKQEPKDFIIDVPEYPSNEPLTSTDDRSNRLNVPQYGYQTHSPGMHTQNSQPPFPNPIDMSKLNVQQYGYQAYSSGIQQNSHYVQNSQLGFANPVENGTNNLNVPQYGYQARSPGIKQNSQHLQNSQYRHVNPMEDRGNRLDVTQYGFQPHSPGMQQNIQLQQFPQNTPNSNQLYPGQISSEYYRAQMQGEVATHPGFTGYTPEYYANTQLANGQNTYENTSSFAPYKQSLNDQGGGNYVNQQVQRFGAVVQSRDYVSKDNSKQQFNEAASGEYTGVDRYNQLKENKYDYNNVYSQDLWGQTNSQQIQMPGIPLAQNYPNINAYPRANAQENVLNYNYEQKLMENYSVRPHGMSNVSNQMLQYAPPQPANTGNVGYDTQQQPGTYRDIYAPATSQEFNKEIKMKENNAPQDNHKYYDQEPKKQTIISSQAGMPIVTEELGQRRDEAIKVNGLKGMWSKETRHVENSKQETKPEGEQVKNILTRDASTNENVLMQHNKTTEHKTEINDMNEMSKFKLQQEDLKDVEKDACTKYSAHLKDLPTAEEIIKQLREENSNSNPVEVVELKDRQESTMEHDPQRLEPIVQHANTEELKEEPIKCELAASREKARIEQVKPEPSRKERVITEQATELQVGSEHVERMKGEESNEVKQVVSEPTTETQANIKPEVNTITTKDNKPENEVQNSQKEERDKNVEIEVEVMKCEEKPEIPPITKENVTNVNEVKSAVKSELEESLTTEPDKVEQARTELATNKAELAKTKEKMKGEQLDEEQQKHDNNIVLKEPPVTMPRVDLTDRREDDVEHKREKCGDSKVSVQDKLSTTDNVNEELTTTDKKDELIENKVDSNQDKKTTQCSANSEVTSSSRDDNDIAKNSYEDSTGSQYVYSESSKDFKLSVASNITTQDTKVTNENIITKEDAPKEIVKNDEAPQQQDAKQQQSNLPDRSDKNKTCKLGDVPVVKVEKSNISQQKDVAKHLSTERKTKSIDQKTSKETSVKGLTHKERAQTKQEILTSKIKAHAEKEISAIREGFANKDGLKNQTKPLGISQLVNIRQKPPSQEVYNKPDQSVSDRSSDGEVMQSPTGVIAAGQLTEVPQKHMKEHENRKDTDVTVTNKELSPSKTPSLKIKENNTVKKNKKCSSPNADKTMETPHDDKLLKHDQLSDGDHVNRADPENTEPSLQLQNERSANEDISLSIMGIMVTVRERNISECNREDSKTKEVISVMCNDTDKHGPQEEKDITTLSAENNVVPARGAQDHNDLDMHLTRETDLNTLSAQKNLTDSTTEKITQQESYSTTDRPQSETQLLDHLAENVVPLTITVPAKNKVLAETQLLPHKQDKIAEETKVYANKASNAVNVMTGIKGQEEITGIRTEHEEHVAISVSTTNTDKIQEDNLHIDSIAIRVVPAVTEEVDKAQQSTTYTITEKESQNNASSQEHVPSNDDVQKVLSSVRKQAQLLKNTNQQNHNDTTSAENEKTLNVDEIEKHPVEAGYFQVDKRDTGPQNDSTNVEQSSGVASEELLRSQSNKPGSVILQDQNMKTSQKINSDPNDKSRKDEKAGEGHLQQPRRHPMAKGRQRGFALQDSADNTVEVKPKPKVPIPEISALADYARLKVIVSKDNEDTLQEQPPNKKEGFFPLIQSRHSRRPVFTMDSQEHPVKEKSSQDQSDIHVKGNKESTPVVFPITDKQHQRTGMFKLGAKENAEVQKIQEMKPNLMEQTSKDKINIGEKNTEDKIKDMLEKSRAKLAEEEKKAAQREEEQRAREREAIAAQIRERRKKQQETGRHAQEEGNGKVIEQSINVEETEQKGKAEERDLVQQKVAAAVNNDKQQQLTEINPDENMKTLQLQQKNSSSRLSEEQQRKAEEQNRRAIQIEEQNKRIILEEQKRRAALEEQQKKEAQTDEQRQKAIKEEQSRVENEEQQRKAEEHKRAILEEKHRKAEEQKRRLLQEEHQKKAAQKEQEEQKRQALIIEEKKKRAALEEQQRKMAQAAVEEQQRRVAQREQKRKIAEEEQKRQAALIEEQKKIAAFEEKQRKMVHEEMQRQAAQEEQKKKAALEEQKRRAVQKEQERKMAEEEERRQAAIIDEMKKRATIEEQQRKMAEAAQEEQKIKAALEEQQARKQESKIAEEEHQIQAAIIEEHRKRATIEEQKRKLAYEEQKQHQEKLRKMAEEEQQKKSAAEEHQRKATLQEQQRRAALEEQLRKNKMAEEEQRRKEALEEQRKMAQIEEMRRQAAHKEKLAAEIEEQKQIVALEDERKRKDQLEEQKQKSAIEEQRKLAQIEETRQEAHKEQLRKMAAEEQRRKAAINEKDKRAALAEQQRGEAQEDQLKKAAMIEEQKRSEALEEEQKRRAKLQEEHRQAAIEEQRKKQALTEKQRRIRQEDEEKQLAYIREERIRRQLEEEREAQIEEERTRQQQSSVQNQTKQEKDAGVVRSHDLPTSRLDARARPARNIELAAEMEAQSNIPEKTEALQYYSLSSAEGEKASPVHKRSNSNGPDTVENISRPYTPASPAISLPRSNAASPAFGTKPSMFKVKDNTIRGSSLTKSIKPRFHKNFGDEFRVASPMEKVWEDQDTLRSRTPSTPLPHYRPLSRRSLALDEEDSRSIISNMSEDVESFATNATDLADIRALYDSDRPESACSFSSDVSRSYGKPPAVPPKSEKALRRAKRLATRRLKKELSKDVTEDSNEASMSEVANADVVASPHFTAPISIARAPPAGSSMSSSYQEPSHQHGLHTAPHAIGPISSASSHTSAPISVPSSQNPGSFSTSVASRSAPQAPSSPTHHHAPKPVTQYQVESGFPQSYTQRRVMQDIGSGQYYVVDVPVEVKTKTFFDPETGKYVQLNVRESNRNAPQRQPLQGYPQPHLKPKLHAKPLQNPSSNAHYHSYSSNSKGHHSAANSPGQSLTPVTVNQDQQAIRSSMAQRQGGPETGYSYSPDKTPYMDTVNKVDKAPHAVYGTQQSQVAITKDDRQLVNSRYGSRDIITMSELEDFMEVSDW